MEVAGADKFAELREGLFALLSSVDRIEEQTDIDLSALRLDIEGLIGKTDRALRSRPKRESAVTTFDYLLRLDSGFTAVTNRWAETRRAAGLVAAQEIVEHSDLHEAWRQRWGDSFEYAWKYRAFLEARSTRTEAHGRPRQGAESLPQVLALDLRYATDLPLSRVAEFFHLSASAVQARVANFEGRVAEEIVHAAIERQLPSGWRIASRYDVSDFELREEGTNAQAVPILIQVVPAWPDRESSVGRPRESSFQPLSRDQDRGRRRVWAVVFFEGPRVYFVPDARARTHAEEAKIPYTRLEMVIQLAPSAGYEHLDDAISFVDALGR